MLEDKSYFRIKKGTERNFAFVFCIFFIIIGLFPLLYDQKIQYWAFAISILFIFFGIFFPNIFVLPNKIWLKLGLLLGLIISPIVMGLIFFLLFFPTGFIMKAFFKDMFKHQINKSSKSYWINRKLPLRSMKDQF